MKRWAAALGPLAVVCGDGLQQQRRGADICRFVCYPGGPGHGRPGGRKFRRCKASSTRTMIKAESGSAPAEGMGRLPGCAGDVPEPRRADVVHNGQYDLEQVPVTWANGRGVVTITFNSNGTIAGLHCYGPPS